MDYAFKKVVQGDFKEIEAKVRKGLQDIGFGVITEIQMHEKLKEKIGVDFDRYVILGACNPALAHKAVSAVPDVGVFLPCNVVLHEKDAGKVHLYIMNPKMIAKEIPGKEIDDMAQSVEVSLLKMLETI